MDFIIHSRKWILKSAKDMAWLYSITIEHFCLYWSLPQNCTKITHISIFLKEVSSKLFWRSTHTHQILSASDQWDSHFSEVCTPTSYTMNEREASQNRIHKSQHASFSPNLASSRCQTKGCVLNPAPPGNLVSKPRIKGGAALCLVFSAANLFLEVDTYAIFAGSSSVEDLSHNFYPNGYIIHLECGRLTIHVPLPCSNPFSLSHGIYQPSGENPSPLGSGIVSCRAPPQLVYTRDNALFWGVWFLKLTNVLCTDWPHVDPAGVH